MKKFMFIFRGSPDEALKLSPEQSQANMQKWFDWVNQLRQDNVYVAGDPLHKQGKVVAGKDVLVTDGPFAEGKELIGGYFIVRAGSMEEAAEMAKGAPDFDMNGSVEVREIVDMDMPS